jgi:hypothetical protein
MMTKNKKYSYIDFAKAAFKWRFKLPLLGDFPVNPLILAGFAILGFGHPGFWLLGLAFEAAYMIFLPGNGQFQKVVIGRDLLKEKAQIDKKKNTMLSFLDAKSAARYEILSQQCAALQRSSSTMLNANGSDFQFWEFEQLLSTFLQLLTSRARILSTLSNLSEEKLKKEIEELNVRIGKQQKDSPLYTSLSSTIAITQRRLENCAKAWENLSIIDAELDRIEKQFTLLKEEASLITDPSMLTSRLDGIMQSMQQTVRWLNDTSDIPGLSESLPGSTFQNGMAKE